ncbi:hypothetical protein [Candidatus Enterococcus lemimoniae]|uniref:hypothetical protein n=1 Tax=Candidatus Enterococcus lemimoniae TaxID=1834167 RepID=UPI000A36E898|nr:hypothetical protein [Enterococcus sp. 12C11_DIV0727]
MYESQRLAPPELMMDSTWRPKGAKFRKKKQAVRRKTKAPSKKIHRSKINKKRGRAVWKTPVIREIK